MPIALLLQDALSPLLSAGLILERWNSMLRLEALVVARARSSFVTHWFGPRLPASGGRLFVAIENIQALTVQYRRARSASVAGDTGPNLLEPLASLAGMGVGMFLSPSGAVLTLFAVVRRELGRIIGVLLTVTHSGPMIGLMTMMGGGVLAGVGLPVFFLLGVGYALYVALTGDDIVEKHELLGDLTRMIQSFTRFINLLTGPRSAVRNPLLRALLEMFDAVAGLVAQLIGAAAWLLTRVVPLIAPNLRQFGALRDLAQTTIELVKDIFGDTLRALQRLYADEEGTRGSPWQALLMLFEHVQDMVNRIFDGVAQALTTFAQQLSTRLQVMTAATETYLTDVGTQALSIIRSMPLMRTMRAAVEMVSAVRTIMGAIPAPPSAPPSAPSAPRSTPATLASGAAALVPALVNARVGSPPPEPSMNAAGTIVALTRAGFRIRTPWGEGPAAADVAPFELSLGTQRRAEELLRPPASVFAGERTALQEELGGRTPAQALETLRTEDLRYRDLLYAVVGRVLPPQMQPYLAQLRETFAAIDERIHGRPHVEQAGEYPVRTVPDNGRLRPKVKRLVLRQIAGDEVSLQNIANDLTRLLREQTYLAPVAP